MGEQKQFKPTNKRLRTARAKGNIIKSPLLPKITGIFALLATLNLTAQLSWVKNKMLLEYSLSKGLTEPFQVFKEWVAVLVPVLIYPLGAVVVGAVAVEAIIGGWLFKPSLALPDLSRSNPLTGIKKIGQGLKQVLEYGGRVFIVGVGYSVWYYTSPIQTDVETSFLHVLLRDYSVTTWCGAILKQAILFGVVTIMFLGLVEYNIRRRGYFRDLSMSLDDLKRENREEETNPEIKGRRAALHQAISNQDLVRRVRSSKVIVVERK